MSFLNNIFGNKKQTTSRSHPLRTLFEEYVEHLPPPSARNDHHMCLTVLSSILRFRHSDGSSIPELSRYTADTCLFELACYVLSSADFWAFNKAPDKRSHIQQILFSQLDAISSRCGFLPEQAAYDYANSRVGIYGRIAAKSSGVEELHLRLKQALRHASTKSQPVMNLDDVPPIFADPFEDLALTKALVAWDMQRMIEMNATLSKIAFPRLLENSSDAVAPTKSTKPPSDGEKVFHFALLPPPPGEKLNVETMRIAAEAWEKKQGDDWFTYGFKVYEGADVIDILEAESAVYWRSCFNSGALTQMQVIGWLQALEKKVGVSYLHRKARGPEGLTM